VSREETMHNADSAAPEQETQAQNDVRDEAASPENSNGVAETTQPQEDHALAEQLVAANKKAQENMDGWQRAMADFQNYKRRTERELKDSYQKASVDMLMNMLPMIDDFERAMANVPDDLKDHPWLNGINLIQRKFNKMLDEQGVVAIDPVGEVFDPSRHEAVGMDDSGEHESGHVTATLQKGYLSGDRVLRPALVRVAN
jgi:molecular chaperone GrpE